MMSLNHNLNDKNSVNEMTSLNHGVYGKDSNDKFES